MKIKAFALNCGNGSLGLEASSELVRNFEASEADLFILNCQETDIKKVEKELANALGNKPFVMTSSPSMVTHTKAHTQLHHQTGMVTLILHKRDVSVQMAADGNKQVRRAKNRFGSGYNKGGMQTRFSINKNNGDVYNIDVINAHIDAFSAVTRAFDWSNVHSLQEYSIGNWEDLSRAIPDIICSGYDANTRNTSQKGNHSKCAWTNPLDPEVYSLVMAPLGNDRMSQPSTYKNYKDDVLNIDDKKRPGYMLGGMLDFVAVTSPHMADLQSTALNQQPLVNSSEFTLHPKPHEHRDHAIIGSHVIEVIRENNDINRVRKMMGCALVGAAPELAHYLLNADFIQNITSIEDQKNYLLTVYKHYLSPTGLLHNHLQLHAEKLQYIAQLQRPLTDQHMLFNDAKPWCAVLDNGVLETVGNLEQLVNKHLVSFELDKMRLQFLRLASSKNERHLIFNIVQNVMNNLPQVLSLETQKNVIIEAKQLLSINQLTHAYGRHLPKTKHSQLTDPVKPNTSLLNCKHGIINNLKDLLGKTEPPSVMVEGLREQIKKDRTLLSKHRDDGSLYTLLRALWGILTLNKTMVQGVSQGGFFAETAEVVMKQQAEVAPEPTHKL